MNNPDAYPTLRKAPPPEWAELERLVSGVVDPDLPYRMQIDAAMVAVQAISGLDMEAVEASRYHGLGLVACGFAKMVFSDTGRARLVDAATAALIDAHQLSGGKLGRRSGAGLYLDELEAVGNVDLLWNDDFALSTEQRLLANLLTHELITRDQVDKYGTSSRDLVDLLAIQRVLEAGVDDTVHIVRRSALPVATALLYEVLRQHAAPDERYPLISTLMSNEELHELKPFLITAGAVVSRLRLDEAHGLLLRGLIYLDPQTRTPHLNRALILDQPPPPDEGYGVRHINRLQCPAKFIAGLIPLVATTVPDAVVAAQERLIQ